MKTFAIAGCGHLGKIVKEAYISGLLKGYKLIATYSRKMEDAEKLTEGTEAKALLGESLLTNPFLYCFC